MTRIIVDSTCDLTPAQAEACGIVMLPLKVRFGNTEYLDKFTITNEEFYAKLRQSAELPKTALVSVGEFLDAYEKYPDDDILVMTLAEKFSGTYQAACNAAKLTERKNIFVVDSRSTSLGFTLLLDKALELRDTLPVGELAETLVGYAERIRIVGIIDTLKYLVKGGRLSALQGSVGGLLGIKPLLMIKHGDIITLAKVRGTQAAYTKLNELLHSKFKPDRKEELVFGHADSLNGLNPLYKFMGNPKKQKTVCIGSVVGTHTGPGVVCVAFYEHKLIGSKATT